eukprot:Platyproteum_vivax@DN208_c0_g1_i2.p1
MALEDTNKELTIMKHALTNSIKENEAAQRLMMHHFVKKEGEVDVLAVDLQVFRKSLDEVENKEEVQSRRHNELLEMVTGLSKRMDQMEKERRDDMDKGWKGLKALETNEANTSYLRNSPTTSIPPPQPTKRIEVEGCADTNGVKMDEVQLGRGSIEERHIIVHLKNLLDQATHKLFKLVYQHIKSMKPMRDLAIWHPNLMRQFHLWHEEGDPSTRDEVEMVEWQQDHENVKTWVNSYVISQFGILAVFEYSENDNKFQSRKQKRKFGLISLLEELYILLGYLQREARATAKRTWRDATEDTD